MYLYPDPAARLAYQRAHMRRQRAGEFRLAIPWEEWRAIKRGAGYSDYLTYVWRELGGPKPPGSSWPITVEEICRQQ